MQNRRAFVTPGTRKQICNGHASKLELRHGSCSSLLMAGLASPTLNSFIQRHRAAAACVAALAFAAFAQDVKTKACGPKRPAAYRGFRGAKSGFFREKAVSGRNGRRPRDPAGYRATRLSHRQEVWEMAATALFRPEKALASRVKLTCCERFANFLPPSMSGISFLRIGCGAGATLGPGKPWERRRLKNDSAECRTKENS
jgi:hypothetical protein